MTEDERRELVHIAEQLRTIKTALSKYAAGERELALETLAVDLSTSLIDCEASSLGNRRLRNVDERPLYLNPASDKG